MLTSDEQFLNIDPGIKVKVEGRTTDSNDVQFSNNPPLYIVNSTLSGRTIDESDVQPLNANDPMVVKLSGRTIDSRKEQVSKAQAPI